MSEERNEALDFYLGNQWPEDVKASRVIAGRPCLVFNFLPQIVESMVMGQQLSDYDRINVIRRVVRAAKDAQMLHNYAMSALMELSVNIAKELHLSIDAEPPPAAP
ncbi:MAG: hypothetical protein ACRD9L_17455 [Bryobacteraceae bacterium]